MNERLRPWLLISRRTIELAAVGSSKMASMVACASPVRTRSAEARRAEEQTDGFDEDGLPGAGLPREHVEPGSNSTSTASMTARLRMRRKRSMHAELQSYHMFDSTQVACYARSSALSQRRAADASEASLHTLGSFVLALQVQDGAAPVSSGSRVLIDIITQGDRHQSGGPRDSDRDLGGVVGDHSVEDALVPERSRRQTAKFLDAFRKSSKFSEVQAVCATLPASPLVGVFQAGYAELNAQFRLGDPQPANPSGAAPRPILKSLDGGRSCAAARGDGRDQQAREARAVSRDGRQRRAVHRLVWNGCWNHDRVPAHRDDRLDQSRGRRPEHLRSADCDGSGTLCGDSGRAGVQPLQHARESASPRRWTTSRSSF